ncbi:MAG: hypothetical protein KAW09_05515, partial [Thermoplasmata archaeon]|nr:hypothetical protein [Thermoplasmata archaeon]
MKMYLGALRAYLDAKNPDSLSQAAHSLRELANSLPKYFGVVPFKRFDTHSQIDRLLRDWDGWSTESKSKSDQLTEAISESIEDSVREAPKTEVSVPRYFYDRLSEFLEEYRSSRMTHRKKIEMLLDSLEPASVENESNVLGPVIRHWVRITDWFVRVCHHGEVEREEFGEKLELYEGALFAMIAPFYAPVGEIDSLLQIEKPTTKDVEKALALFKKREHVRYFFENLSHAGWISSLAEQGYFKNPPKPVTMDGYVSYPSWPESRFLRRVAGDAPDTVIEIVIHIPETDNVRVQDDLIEALLAMPANMVTRMIDRVKGWVRSQSPLLLPRKFGKLMAKLATEGETESALDLSDVVLQPVIEHSPQAQADSQHISLLAPEAGAYFDNWSYRLILEECYPVLVKADPRKAFELLCQKLKCSIELELGKGHPQRDDASYVWRPAIEPHKQNRGTDDVKNALVSAIRDAGQEILQTAIDNGEEYLDYLVSLELSVSRRLELHLLRVFGDRFAPRIAERLGEKTMFDDLRCRHEYGLLLSERFTSLPEETKTALFNWVEEGPGT